MGITSSGIGSGLDVDGIIRKLMAVEAAPLANFDKKTAEQQSKLAALNKLNGAIGVFQSSLSGLSSPATFRALTAAVANKDVFSASASSDAAPGNYKVKVTQLAQAQSLSSAGQASMTALLGGGAPTTLTFQFGAVSGGSFGVAGSAIPAGTASAGIANGALTINGTAITTDGATRSARQLADAINATSAGTGVTAAAGTTATSATLFGGSATPSFGAVDTVAGASYALSVGGVQIAAQADAVAAGAGVTAATIDTALTGNNATTAALAAANITFTGSAAAGTLQFVAADGSNITVSELVTGTVNGGIGKTSSSANTGTSVTATSAVTLTSASATPIVIGGSNPAAAGLAAGTAGAYLGGSFALDGAQSSGTVVLDAGSQSLQGIRDAINKAAIGVSASIVSDGSASPYHLVLTSNKTGASSTMKISLSGEGGNPPDAALAGLLGYDVAGAQQLTQTSAAQSALLTVNGIAVTSNSNNVSGAVQGVTLDLAQVGASTVSVTRDTTAVKDAVNSFVKAYNELNKTMKDLTSYDPATKRAGVLVGDTTVRSIQTQLRQQLGQAVGGLGQLTTLSQVGISFQRDGSLAVDSGKLNKAMTDNYSDIGGLFAAIGAASDSLVKVSGSSAATKPGNYAVNITALATQGALTSAAPLATTVIEANTTWSVTLNQTDPVTASKIANIALSAGSYTATELAALLRSAINGSKAFADAGDSVETSVDASGKLVVASSRYGAASNIAIGSISGTDPSVVFGAATPAAGADVVGTIGGMAATGSGQTLTGQAGSGVEGLKLDITGGLAGERGTVSFSQGYAYQLNNLAAALVGKDGLITGRTDGFNASIKSVAQSRDAFSSRLEAMEKRYRAQFTALDTMLASMQSTSSYLTQQLAALANNT